MRYMIHASPQRMWYINEFLIPSMKDQAIRDDEIMVWEDTEGKGNLFSCMDSFLYCGEHPQDGTWHIQDDVILGKYFGQMTRYYNDNVRCGFVQPRWGPDPKRYGNVPAEFMWYSFQCIRIPDKLAYECAKWFYEDASKRDNPKYQNRIARRKHDDDFFRYFLLERHPKMRVFNMKPNLVDHVDYLIGGTLINKERKDPVCRAAFFPDPDLVDALEEKLKERDHLV